MTVIPIFAAVLAGSWMIFISFLFWRWPRVAASMTRALLRVRPVTVARRR